MNLGALILALRPLVSDVPGHWTRIVDLLADHRDLAEYEVARAFVLRFAAPELERTLLSLDPLERRAAVDLVPLIYPRAAASRVLRRLVKDPDLKVRSGARKAVRLLGLNDVALPDRRAAEEMVGPYRRWPESRHPAPTHPGAWNPSGWATGLRGERFARARPRRPTIGPMAAALTTLPRLDDPPALARHLGYDEVDLLTKFLRPGEGSGSGYVEFEVAKATGGVRRIAAPRAELKALQRKLLDDLVARVPVHEACHGFVRGRSTVTNARPHVGAAIIVKTDLVDFFPSVHYRRVVGLFAYLGYDLEVARLLAGLTTHRPTLADGRVVWPGVLPQGAPTSPMIANLVARRLDARLSALASKVGATYTRYADDLTFSFRAAPEKGLGRFLWWVDQVCQQEGFTEHAAKRRIFRPSHQQRVTGIVVNETLSVPREARRRFRAILANCRRRGVASQARGRSDFRDYLLGFASYVHMVQPALGAALLAEVRELLDGGA